VAWIGSIRTFVAKDFRLKISGGDLMLSASDPSVNIHRENSAGHAGMLFMISGSPIFFRSVKHCFVEDYSPTLGFHKDPRQSSSRTTSLPIRSMGTVGVIPIRPVTSCPGINMSLKVKEGLIQLKYTPS
jgi:hypothetical protein